MSKAIAALVRLGLENQENRKREFFKKLKENLAKDDPKQEDRLVDEFRALILGRGSMPKIEWERLPREKWAHLRHRRKRTKDLREGKIQTCPTATGTRTSARSNYVAPI